MHTTYELQQGFPNQREGGIVWTTGQEFPSLEEAEAAADGLKGKWRIVSHTVELASEQ
jgi:hypothetical protein